MPDPECVKLKFSLLTDKINNRHQSMVTASKNQQVTTLRKHRDPLASSQGERRKMKSKFRTQVLPWESYNTHTGNHRGLAHRCLHTRYWIERQVHAAGESASNFQIRTANSSIRELVLDKLVMRVPVVCLGIRLTACRIRC
jgi:hypothetical protein